MIEKVQSYKVGEAFFDTFEDAQLAELETTLGEVQGVWTKSDIANHILENKERFIDVLSMTPRSRAKARTINGAKRKRKASSAATNAALQDSKQ